MTDAHKITDPTEFALAELKTIETMLVFTNALSSDQRCDIAGKRTREAIEGVYRLQALARQVAS